MFERLMERATRSAERRAKSKIVDLAVRMRAELPRGVQVEVVRDGVRLCGRRLKLRFVLEPALRWLTAKLR